MKRRSLFAGLMAAFAPVAPVVAAPVRGPSAVDGMIAESRAYYKGIAQAAMDGMNKLAAEARQE